MSKLILDLASQVREVTELPRYAALKSLWSRHNRLEDVGRLPAAVFLHHGYTETWQELIPPDTLQSADPFERDIELQLRQKLFRHYRIPDDYVLLPTVWVTPIKPEGSPPLWGVELTHIDPHAAGGAYAFEPVVREESDLARLAYPSFVWDEAATNARIERARELVGDLVPVKLLSDEIRANPGERLVEFMGWEGFLYGLTERPELVHKLMEFLTEGFIHYHKDREAKGVVDVEESWWYRVHYEELPPETPTDRLSSSWVYITAQTTGGISPAMYAEFIQPYNERIARIFGAGRVYYHGCEDLSRKLDVIGKLPNLRRFHVSPWTSLEAALAKFGGTMVYETHANPATTTLSLNPVSMRREVEGIVRVMRGQVADINLSDIQTVSGNPEILTTWAEIAREVGAS